MKNKCISAELPKKYMDLYNIIKDFLKLIKNPLGKQNPPQREMTLSFFFVKTRQYSYLYRTSIRKNISIFIYIKFKSIK